MFKRSLCNIHVSICLGTTPVFSVPSYRTIPFFCRNVHFEWRHARRTKNIAMFMGGARDPRTLPGTPGETLLQSLLHTHSHEFANPHSRRMRMIQTDHIGIRQAPGATAFAFPEHRVQLADQGAPVAKGGDHIEARLQGQQERDQRVETERASRCPGRLHRTREHPAESRSSILPPLPM